ncbi:hypothetical protein I6F33_21795 [Bradyrhizobium sp. BRP20]|uniref:hypothetical protein n=1 Tax=Bradyrhizobium sp. BRP20 TaxID=2793822 RepID=UPI001CD618EB|nr:hypothetical protein [Bradyrhizobium sp. BRP20]MCA1435600.1 hypothetical protein [Bradyrhizobium sp. BRP20]
MAARRDPLALPEWHALHREATLVSQLIGAGTTALGRASYASRFGDYYTAFFGLSIGIERLAKLILIADYVLEHSGKLPDQAAVKRYGHKLGMLVEEADRIAKKHNLKLETPKPDGPIPKAIILCLDAFADASKGRYANFEAIGNPAFNPANEPVAMWWREVVEPILKKHYRGTRAEAGVKARAQVIDAMIGGMSSVNFFDESGGTMDNVATASERTGQTRWAQKYGRFYTLSIVRWLSEVFSVLTQINGYKFGLEVLFGHYEFFNTYRVDDNFLLTRRNWPLS